jgi:dsRNA-specific ribonuclease
MDRHLAIYQTYSNVIKIEGDPEKEVCRDKDDNIVTIDNSVIAALIAANEYKEKRKAEYPAIEDQLDTIYHNGVAGWKATIKAIKDKYPKPS